MSLGLEGRRALVTGGGSGIGRAVVLRLAREGARVGIVDVREGLAEEVAEVVASEGGEGSAIRCDVASESDVERAVAATAEAFGGLDALVACAGIATPGLVAELALEDWDLVLRVNLTGTFLSAKHAVPHLREAGGGAIVTIGSVWSVVVGAGGAAASYMASKGGILQLTKVLAVEHADDGIRANCVCPGAVATRLGEHVRELVGEMRTESPSVRDRITIVPPMERRADPDEIASVVAFLVSDESSFMTGSAVMVDGGYTAI